MRAVVQRVSAAEVRVAGATVGRIKEGLLVYLGVGAGDSPAEAATMAEKVCNLRVFTDTEGKMNHSLLDRGGEVLAIPQFTLFGDVREGRRPSYTAASPPEAARPLFEEFVRQVAARGVPVRTGVFRETMEVDAVNHGPVTILIDTAKTF